MKTLIAFLFRLVYRKELKAIMERQEKEWLDVPNQGFVESMVTSQRITSERNVLQELNLID